MLRVFYTVFTLFILSGIFLLVIVSFPEREKVVKVISFQIPVIKKPEIRIIYKEINSYEDIVKVRCEAVKPITYTKVISLKDLPSDERKEKFIDLVLPSILIANYEVSVARENLLRIREKLLKGYRLSKEEVEFLEEMLERCKSDSIEDALKKAHPVPPSLVLAQAIIETGWGTSRFFVEGLNLFGMWTFREDIEYITTPGGRIKLKKYRSILDSVRDYIYTVNVGWAYKDFREFRLKDLDSIKLSGFLEFYSIERERYVAKLRKVIIANNLKRYDSCFLDTSYTGD